MIRLLVVFAAGVAAIASGVVAVMDDRAPRQAGNNGIKPVAFDVVAADRRPACQTGELVPKDAASLEMTIGTFGAPGAPLEATFTKDGRTVTSGRLARGWHEGVVRVPLRPVARTTGGVTVCIRSASRGRIALAGHEGRFRLAYFRAGRESWFDLAGTVTHRFGLGKAAWEGSWTIVLAAFLLLTGLGLALWTMLRQSRA
ncbi:MAG TPA: hypothetical protein VF517_05710 [Thermoleophilaceae bacterium]|jgi:hypothetical protein